MDNDIEVILFDLGGVLVELGATPFPVDWFAEDFSFDLHSWHDSRIALDFERGQISVPDFACAIKAKLNLPVSINEIIDQFTQWPVGLYPGAHELLLTLKSSYTLVVLSNTNELHWPRIIHEFKLEQYFAKIFASHQLHMAKPEPELFKHILAQLRVAPKNVLFFDDNPANIAAASKLGIISQLVNGFAELRQQLQKHNML